MTPICYCTDPRPVVTQHPANQYHGAYTTTHCTRCGNHYSVEHGSRASVAEEAPDAK
jgi:hypothetical protein